MAVIRRDDRKQAPHRLAAWVQPVALRLARGADHAALAHLAELDSHPLPPGPHLVAERDGRIHAALSLSTHELIADPFRRTAELCELLRCHAGGLRIGESRLARSPSVHPRLQEQPV